MNRPVDFTPKNSSIIFHHIYKCAGTSISKHYFESYDAIQHAVYSHHDWNSIRNKMPELTASDKPLFLYGHEAWGIHGLLPEHITPYYFTFLREPVRLFLSAWNYKRLKCDDDYASLDDMLHKHECNIMVHALGNGSLSTAKKRLTEEFALFGLVEEFHTSLKMHERFFGLDISKYSPANVAGSSMQLPTSEEVERIKQHNRLDMELYDYARTLFDRRCSEAGLQPGKTTAASPPRPKKTKESLTPSSTKAMELIESKEYGRALEAMKQLPPNHDFAKNIAKLHAKRNELEEAEKWFRKAWELYPMCYDEYADFLLRHDHEKGMAFLEEELAQTERMPAEPEDSCLNRIRRDILTKMALHCHDDTAHAERLIRTALPDGYGEISAVQKAAVVFRRIGRHDEAVSLLDGFIAGHPGSPDLHTAHLEIVATLHEAGETKQVVERLRIFKNSTDLPEMPLESGSELIVESVPLKEVLSRHPRLIACSCAPLLLLSHFAVCLEQCSLVEASKPDLFIQRGRREAAKELNAFNRLHPVPDERLSHDAPEAPDWEEFRAENFDAALLLCSNLDFEDYIEWFKVLRLMDIEKVYFFPRSNITTGSCTCLKPADSALNELLTASESSAG